MIRRLDAAAYVPAEPETFHAEMLMEQGKNDE
jgi:hypothetical protein